MAALLRFARIFKEPMISRNLFGKPVKCIGTTSCLQTAKYKYSDKLFKQTLSFSHFSFSKLFRIVFAGPYAFLVGPYAFFRPYHLDTYGPKTGTFSYGFPRKLRARPYGSYDNIM